MRRLGQAGMPDTIRITVESLGAHPQRSGFCAAATVDAYVSAFLLLDRHEVAALALTLGILCFAVITAILLVRTRQRLAAVAVAAHDQAIAARSAIDRA